MSTALNQNKRGGSSLRIYEALKKEILTGEIESGSLLSESEIGRRFDVSRSPARDALSRLACERLVSALPQRGHLVRTVSFSEIIDSFRVRELLEVEAAGLAAARITDAEIDELRKIFFPEALADEPLMWNFNFHSRVAWLSGSRLLANFITETLILMQSMLSNHPEMRDNSKENIDPEKKIMEAIIARDPEAARAAMREHLQESKKSLVEMNMGRISI